LSIFTRWNNATGSHSVASLRRASEIVDGTSDREKQLDAFKAGKEDVISNCMMLAEGFDRPQLRTVFCRPSGKSLTVQDGRTRCGGLHPDEPIKSSRSCRASAPSGRSGGRRHPANQYVWTEGEWRSLRGQSADQSSSVSE
jgi:hypothetical protein